MLFEYLRTEPLFEEFTLISPSSHPLNLTSPIFATSQNLIVQHLCAFQISKSRIAILKIYPVFTPASPSDFGITNFCNITVCNSATFMCFLCAFQISESRTVILKIYPGFTPQSLSGLTSPILAISKNGIALHLCAFYVLLEYLRDE